jgi:hypothetical protein
MQVQIQTGVETLHDMRVVAILMGDAPTPAQAEVGVSRALIETWRAVGKRTKTRA